MSIIEKAVNRLGPETFDPRPRGEPVVSRDAAIPVPARTGDALVSVPAPAAGERAMRPDVTAHTPATSAAEQPVDDARGATSRSQLAEIDLARLRAAGMITPDNVRSQISEEFRVIKRPLITNAFNRGSGTAT